MEVDTIILDDGIEYAIIKEIKINDTFYTLFSNINNPKDVCFRKAKNDENGKYYIGLDNEDEFNMVVNNFAKILSEDIKSD